MIVKTIGITGGSSLHELGSAAEVQSFFDCLDAYVVRVQPAIDWSVLSDRLYKRYLRQQELETALKAMGIARELFRSIPSKSIDWSSFDFEHVAERTKLNLGGSTLGAVFDAYFDSFAQCAESAKLSYEAFKDYAGYQYEPVRIVVSDQPWFIVEKNRPLRDYDDLEGKPFWLVG